MQEIKRKVIEKHLEGWERSLKNASIEHFAKSGKVSGSFSIALKDMLDDYVMSYVDFSHDTLVLI